jgi:tetratricopeptide (TPR) repeat protein
MRLSADTDKAVIYPTLSHLGHALYKNKELDAAAETYLESFKIQVSIVTGEECGGLVEFSNDFNAFKEELKSMVKDDDDVAALSEALGGIASILRYLGLVHHAQGDPEYALNINKLSLSVRLCQPHREDAAIAVMAETIAMFEFKRNNLNSAHEYFNQALRAKKSVQGTSTIDIARTVNNLANIHFSLGNLDDAMKLYQEALEIKKHCLGEDSDDVANTLNNIAHVMVTAGKDQDALQAYHNVLKIRQDKYGKNHVSVAATLASMGDVYIKLGKLEIARTYLEQVTRIRNLQNESRDERVMENLASIYGKLGEWQRAEMAFKEILLLKRSSYGNDCLDVAKTLDLLAVSYIEQDRCADSIEHLQEALRIRKVSLGVEDDEVLASLNKLAFVYKSCDMTDKMLEVKEEFDRIQAIRKR